jgi:hypothetical protein
VLDRARRQDPSSNSRMLACVSRLALLLAPRLVSPGALAVVFALVSHGGCTTATVAEPADATAPGGADPGLHADVVEGAEAPKPTVDAPAGPGPSTPTASKPTQPYNCQAPLVVIEEVSRLLTVAGTHATRSAACVDGPGQRVTIDEVLVCPLAPDGTRRPFGVTYRVTTWNEGGRQVCAGKCPPVEGEHTFHRVDVTFAPGKGGHVIEPPKSLPGLPLDATLVTTEHDGDCYGKSPAFEPQPLPLR